MSAPAASAPAPAAVGSTTSAAAGAPALPPGVIAYVTGRLKEMWGTIQKEQKPWAEVLDRNALSKPENLGEVRCGGLCCANAFAALWSRWQAGAAARRC